MARLRSSRLLPTVLHRAEAEEWGIGIPTVLFPPEPGSRAARRASAGRRITRLWQMLLLALAAAGVTGFLSQALG